MKKTADTFILLTWPFDPAWPNAIASGVAYLSKISSIRIVKKVVRRIIDAKIEKRDDKSLKRFRTCPDSCKTNKVIIPAEIISPVSTFIVISAEETNEYKKSCRDSLLENLAKIIRPTKNQMKRRPEWFA